VYPRWIRPRIERALLDTPAVFVAGPRQSGKSTLVRLIRQDGYVTLDRATVRAGAGADPDGFVAGLPVPVALDEVQRVPDLLLAVKAEIDEHRQPGRFLLTGSVNVLMLPKVADMLPGRMEIVELWPLSQGEVDNRPESFVDAVFETALPAVVVTRVTRGELFDRVLCGGFPESLQRPVDRRSDWFESYLTAVVEREVRDLSNVGSVGELTVMIRLIAARAGSLFNLADVARGAQLPHSTARNYLGLLRAVFLVVDVPAWTTSLTTRIVRAPKLFLIDSGLTAHLLGIGGARLASEPHLADGLFEAFVAMELRKQISWSHIRPALAHFRTRSGDEVKSSATVRSGDFAGLRVLEEIAGHRFRRGVVLYTGTDVVSFGPKLVAAPVSLLWS
jgi:uncharacterized protein